MTQKTILITGGTDGIGKATAIHLAKTGDDLIIVGRNAEKGQRAQREIAEATGASVRFMAVDMSLMSEVQRLATELLNTDPKVDILIHCAGVINPEPIITPEGLELVFATQYLSRYLLTSCLIPALKAGGKTLFVSGGNVTDGTVNYEYLNNKETFKMFRTVQNTSRAQSLYTHVLMTDHPYLGIYNYGPGIVKTAISRNISGFRGLLGAVASFFVAVPPEQVGLEIAELLEGSYISGWYKRGLNIQSAPEEKFTAEQSELKRFSEKSLLLTDRSYQ